MVYNKVYRVPTWVIVEDGPKAEPVLSFLAKKGALVQEYPSNTLKRKIEQMKNRGYHHIWENPDRVILPPDMLMRAVSDHMKDTVSQSSLLTFNNALFARVDRQIRSDDDYVRLMNYVLSIQPDINLSQSFQIMERCFKENGNNVKVFCSVGPVDKNILQRVSDTVITIGEADGSDINIKGVDKKDLKKELSKYFE